LATSSFARVDESSVGAGAPRVAGGGGGNRGSEVAETRGGGPFGGKRPLGGGGGCMGRWCLCPVRLTTAARPPCTSDRQRRPRSLGRREAREGLLRRPPLVVPGERVARRLVVDEDLAHQAERRGI